MAASTRRSLFINIFSLRFNNNLHKINAFMLCNYEKMEKLLRKWSEPLLFCRISGIIVDKYIFM